MARSAFIEFKKGNSIPASQIASTIQRICNDTNILCNKFSEKFNDSNQLKYIRLGISDIPIEIANSNLRTIRFNIFDEPYEYREAKYEWDISGIEYFRAVSVENIFDNSDLFLKIIYSLFKECPEAKFWTENDWFYTLKDLEKIQNQEFNKLWFVTNPKDL